jgi:hypothetical protein
LLDGLPAPQDPKLQARQLFGFVAVDAGAGEGEISDVDDSLTVMCNDP